VVEWNSQGKPIRMSGTHTDITELKHAEESLKQKNEELVKINAEKDKFFSIIAHDLRGPFGAFMGLTEVLTEELPIMNPVELSQLAETMRKSALNLNGLLNNLLEWARMHRGLISFRPETINLHSFIMESTEIIMESARNKSIDIEYLIPIELQMCADVNTIQSVIRNLVSNAVKFTPKEGKIQVLARAIDPNNVEISVKDSGIGMNARIMGHLFDIDVRTNRNGTDGEPSTGLGLILCKEFIERNNGKLWMESVEGMGSAFYFTVPSRPSPTNTEQNAKSLPITESEKKAVQIQILISEDDNTSALLLKRLVSGFCNKALMAVNGVGAVDFCRNYPDIQLILMDINMPEMDGYEATRQIRSFNQEVVIIAQTAFVLDNDQKKVLQSGFNDFLPKPIAKDKLLAMVHKYFG
jgi:CheY-like chemotaxis protein